MYPAKSSMESGEERPRNYRSRVRRPQLCVTDSDGNANSNNNGEPESLKSNLDAVVADDEKRAPGGSRSPGRNRKSKLIEAMSANFEKKDSNSRSTLNASPTLRTSQNGENKQLDLLSPDSIDADDNSSPPETRKSGSSVRRGKKHREKRMLRQKRRSTGVVNKKDVEESERLDRNEDDTRLENETEVNTQTNELSPVSTHAPISRISAARSESTAAAADQTDEITITVPTAATTVKSSSTDSPRLQHRPVGSHANTKTSSHSELEMLRSKLETAEITITKLRKEIKVMDHELHSLEEENHSLKEENKMLEDENKTMLKYMRR